MREGGRPAGVVFFFTESLLYNGELFYVRALNYLFTVISFCPLFTLLFVYLTSSVSLFFSLVPLSVRSSLQDMVTKYQKRKNKTWEWKKKKQKNACFVCRHHSCFLGGGRVARVCFFTRRFQEQERIMQYSFIPLQSVLFRITPRGEVILKSNVKLPSVLCISDKSLMDRPGCFI